MSALYSLLVFVLPALAVGILPRAWASTTEQNYSATTWRVEEGLPEDTVQAFAESPTGYLWIGTSGGLARFDGEHFSTPANVANSVSHEFNAHCLLVARDGSLWIGTEGSGLIQERNGIFRTWTDQDGLTDMFVRAILEDHAGNLWIGTNNGFFRMTRDRVTRLDDANGVPALAVNAILEDRSGRIWTGGSRVMSIIDGKFQEHALAGEPSRNRVKSLLQTSDGAVWVGTVSGLYRSLNGVTPFERVAGVHGTVRALHQSKDGALWMSIVGQGGIVWKLGPDGTLATQLMHISGTVLSLFEDSEGNIWAGTQAGMTRYSRTPIGILSLPDARNSDFGTVYLDRDGALWSAATRLVRIMDGQAKPHTFTALRGAKVRNLLRDRDKSLWIGTDGSGLFHLVGKTTTRYTTAQGLANNFVRAMVQAHDGSMWIGTDEGISHLNAGRLTSYGVKDGLAYFSIRTMMEDTRGEMWIGTDQGLSHLLHGRFVVDEPVVALRQEKIWAMHEDADGGLWFGTRNHGLYRYRAGALTQFGVANGLASNTVYAILEDSAGHFWISSPNRISLLNRHDLDSCANQSDRCQLHPVSITSYRLPEEDGPVQIFGGVQNAASIGASGEVWFPSSRGLVYASLPPERSSTVPRLEIDQVSADHFARPWTTKSAEVALGPGNSILRLAWGLVTLSSQENARFRYRLDPVDRQWVNTIGRRDVSYVNLSPGRYMFHLLAYETDHTGAETEITLLIIKNPYFYRRWWFIALMVMAALGAAIALYRVRIQRMKQRFAGVLEERNRIAREIHDTVIQGCTGVSAALEAISTIAPEQTDLRDELLGQARAQVRDTIDEGRRAVWNLRQETTRGMLDLSISTISAQMSKEFGIPVRCAIEGRAFAASQPVTHEILMIAREAVHNAVLHAAPTAVTIVADFHDDTLTLEISDDGSGFDLDKALTNGNGHYGILGMRERAARLRAKIDIQSVMGQGTHVVLRVPKRGRATNRTIEEEVKAL